MRGISFSPNICNFVFILFGALLVLAPCVPGSYLLYLKWFQRF